VRQIPPDTFGTCRSAARGPWAAPGSREHLEKAGCAAAHKFAAATWRGAGAARDDEGTAACARFRLTSLPHAVWPPWSPSAMPVRGLPQKGVAQSVLSLSVRQCWHAHPELSFDT